MIVIDENFPESQRQLLRGWRIPARQIGIEVGHKGVTDEDIIPLLLRLRRPTFFSLDADFYKPDLCHARYCLVCVDVRQYEAVSFVRRLLRQPEFKTQVKRSGVVIRMSHTGFVFWRLHAEHEQHAGWGS